MYMSRLLKGALALDYADSVFDVVSLKLVWRHPIYERSASAPTSADMHIQTRMPAVEITQPTDGWNSTPDAHTRIQTTGTYTETDRRWTATSD